MLKNIYIDISVPWWSRTLVGTRSSSVTGTQSTSPPWQSSWASTWERSWTEEDYAMWRAGTWTPHGSQASQGTWPSQGRQSDWPQESDLGVEVDRWVRPPAPPGQPPYPWRVSQTPVPPPPGPPTDPRAPPRGYAAAASSLPMPRTPPRAPMVKAAPSSSWTQAPVTPPGKGTGKGPGKGQGGPLGQRTKAPPPPALGRFTPASGGGQYQPNPVYERSSSPEPTTHPGSDEPTTHPGSDPWTVMASAMEPQPQEGSLGCVMGKTRVDWDEASDTELENFFSTQVASQAAHLTKQN